MLYVTFVLMAIGKFFLILLISVSAYAAPAPDEKENDLKKAIFTTGTGDLKTASSSYSSQYADWGGSYPGGYGFSVTGFGIIDDYSNKPNYKGFSGYDNSLKSTGYSAHNALGYEGAGYKGYYGSNNIGPGAHGASGYSGSEYGTNGYGARGYDGSGYGGNGLVASGYSGSGYDSGYGNTGYIPNSLGPVQKGFDHSHGNGGYGGFNGNGGLNSYYGYNNPNYVGGGHLGYGYYKGNIYHNAVTPNLVTGYRGYTRR